MAADIYGTAVGELQTSSASWTCSTPAGLTGHRLLLALAYRDKGQTPSTPSGWTPRSSKAHSASIGSVYTFEKVLTGDVSASTVAVTFSGSVVGISGCVAIDGEFDSAATPTETGWVTSATPPSGVASEADCVLINVVATTQYPRYFGIGAPSIELLDLPGPGTTPPETPALQIAKKVVGSGTTASNLVSTTNQYGGFGDDSQLILMTLVYKTVIGASPPPSGSAVTFVGDATTVDIGGTSVSITVRGGEDGDGQYVVLNHSAAASAVVTPASGFAQISASTIDASIGRLVLYERVLTGTTGDTSETFNFSTTVVGVAGSFTVRGTRADLQRNASTQSNYLLTAAPPSVTITAASSLVVSIVGSGNWNRSQTPGADIAVELIDNWPGDGPSLAIGAKWVDAGTHTLAAWSPADPDTPGAEAGDFWRMITLGFVPIVGGGGGGAAVAGSGTWAYVAGTIGLTVTPTSGTTATSTWQDVTADETSFEYSVAQFYDSYPALISLAANTTTLSLTGLTPGAAYKMIVAAKRGSDWSAYEEAHFAMAGTALTVAITKATPPPGSESELWVDLQISPALSGQPIVWTLTGPGDIYGKTTITNSLGGGGVSATTTGVGNVYITATVSGYQSNTLIYNVGAVDEDLILTLSPARLEKNQVATARVTGSLGGKGLVGLSASLASTNDAVMADPANAIVESTVSGGEAVFTLPALDDGTTSLTATINGVDSNTVSVVVAYPSPPVDYTASGVTSIAIHIEAPLAAASKPRIRRMTHADQQFYHPGDDGFKFANQIALREHVFFTASKFR